MNIAIIQKCPSKLDFKKLYELEDCEVFNLCSHKVSKLLIRNVDLTFDPNQYDYVILVGSEAVKYFTKQTSVTDFTGKRIEGKCGYANFIPSISPAMLTFKPENKPVFDSTVKAIKKIIDGVEEDVVKKDYRYSRATFEIESFLDEILNSPMQVVALDSETSALAPRDGFVLGLSFSYKVDQGFYVDADEFDHECVQKMQKIIDLKDVVFHNAKFDMAWLTLHLGINFHSREGHVHDTLVMHYLLDERQGTHGLKSLAMKYTNLGNYEEELDTWKKKFMKENGLKAEEFSYSYIPWDIIKIYGAQDTDATLQLYYKFEPVLRSNRRLWTCYTDLMLPALHFLTRMENVGVPVSAARLHVSRDYLTETLDEARRKLWEYPEVAELEKDQEKIFNPNSPMQLRKLLFDYLKLTPTGKLTGTGAISTDATVLTELAEVHPVPKLLLEIRQTLKLRSTYIDKLIPVIDQDSRVRTGFNLTSTTSGRLSSSGRFNMQQLPRDNPIIKGCVKAPEGYKIVALDLTTAEIYFAAVLSGDKAMQQVFINMKKDPAKYPDFHANIAHMVFKLDCEPSEVKSKFPALRQAAKAISFGILYGSGPAKVAEAVNEAFLEQGQPASCTKGEATEYIKDYFNAFKQLKKWIYSCHDQIKQKGFIFNHFGRKRRLLNVHSADKGIAAGEVRSGFNAVIQSISSDTLLLGAIDADKYLRENDLPAEIFALVHDSVVAIVKEEFVEEYTELMTQFIQRDRGCSIPGYPVGVEADSEVGGSVDYSCGKLDKMYPEIAKL